MKKKAVGKIAKALYEEKINFGKHSFMDFLMSKTRSFQRFQEMSAFVTSILKASNYPFFVVDTEFYIQYMNPACLGFTGSRLNEMAGHTCRDIFSSNACHGDCAIRQAMVTRRPVIGKWVKVRDRGGREHTIVVNAGALIDAKGEVLGGFEMWRDAMPEAEAASKIQSLLGKLNDYQSSMSVLINKLEKSLPAPVAGTIKTSMIFDEMRKKTSGVLEDCSGLFRTYCWNTKDCPPERQVQCPAFPNHGQRCWEIDYTWCDGQMQGEAKEKKEKCATCKVYQNFKVN